ncbi:DMT family transporter [Chloroflexus sp.]|uniref:DMT family transporter n=1 Tax=Chloroflexus sp. TaxID=1904827 RepID=UPI00298F270B|nr:DMT family transporter [Chloroflexus sp.]MCS6887687.1 DMT family transporter [Chloroflexus sp.]MDW8403947.1 DMT family transporter [Chloroflexus sp.]
MSMGIIYGLIAALGWGTGDFLITRATRQIGWQWTLLLAQLTGIVAIGLVLLGRSDPLPPWGPAWPMAVAVNLLNLTGTLLLYRAFAIGTLAIVSPISASFAAVTAALALLDGEQLGAITLAGTGLVIGGVVVVSRGPGKARADLRGVPEAIGVAISFGLFFWLIGDVTATFGIAWPVLIGRIVTVLGAVMILVLSRPARPRLGAAHGGLIIAASALDTIAFLSFNTGIATAYVSVVTALASIFSAVTVVLAWLVLRERLARSQWLGVAGILAGVLLVSLP